MRFLRALFICAIHFLILQPVYAQSIDEKVADFQRFDGLIPIYLDEATAKVYLRLTQQSEAPDRFGRYLYAHGLTSGLGSNPVGLDRGLGSGTEIISFEKIGSKLFIRAENNSYRASADNDAEKRAVRSSFASSILWAGEISATDGNEILADITDFLLRDATGIAARIKARGQGSFTLDKGRSAVDLKATLTFPDNIEFDAILTFKSSNPGPEIRSTAAQGENITLVQHHSFIRLPDDGYQPRVADQRTGVIENQFYDYSAALKDPLLQRYARRFRLQKTDSNAARSTVKKPIIFYIDNGAPEAIQQALIDGVSWWAEAFEDAGFINAFQVKVLPEDAHPMDVRYNVVQWVHRATRGWSYGGGIADPRTGEMIKAMVILGSQRVRQDRMIFEGLVGADKTGTGGPNDPEQVALARIRQLGAHEVGHTIGFAHNMAASTYGNRASVMDYPAPQLRLDSTGNIDLSNAYGVGIGAWDKFTVKWLYSEFPQEANESLSLDRMTKEALDQGLLFVADPDARPLGAAHPLGNLWDTGTDPILELENLLKIRKTALADFGLNNLAKERFTGDLHEVFVPIYLLHRFQVQAAAKSIGGFSYGYSKNGDGQKPAKIVEPTTQNAALDALLSALEPNALDIRDETIALLTPHASGPRRGREKFTSPGFPAFDPLNAAEVAASLVFDALLHPARANRLNEFHRQDSRYPSLESVLAKLRDHVFSRQRESLRHAEIRRAVQRRFVSALIALADGKDTSTAVKVRVERHLEALADTIGRRAGRDSSNQDNAAFIYSMIERHRARSATPQPAELNAPKVPPGQPIGSLGPNYEEHCWSCL